MRKIRFTMLLHEKGELSLKSSKEINDRILKGEIVEMDFKDTQLAELIYTEACKLGVECELIPNHASLS